MKEMMDLTGIVKRILVEQIAARNNVWALYYEVCKVKCPSVMNAKFGTVLKSYDVYNLPKFESVARVRRKVVEEYPELAGSESVEGGRWSSEQKFREYAKVKV